MKTKWPTFLIISTLAIIQNCTTTEKISTEKHDEQNATVADEEINSELQVLKAMLGYEPRDAVSHDTEKKNDQPVEFGASVARVQELFPAPDKFEFDPMVNGKVTMLARPSSGGRFTFFFYEDKLYKIIMISKWSNFMLQSAEEDIKRTEEIFVEGNGKPDLVEEDEIHKKLMWLKDDLEITLEEFNLMSHKGINRVMSLSYTDRRISPLARKDESFELYKTKRKEIVDR